MQVFCKSGNTHASGKGAVKNKAVKYENSYGLVAEQTSSWWENFFNKMPAIICIKMKPIQIL